MDKTSKKVLNYLCEYKDYNNYSFFFVGDMLQEFSKRLNMKPDELRACITYLHNKDYVDYTMTSNEITGFVINHNGIHHDEFRFIDRKKFIKTSVIVPIVVSFLTTLLIDGLKWLLPLIQKLLLNIPK